MTPRLRTAVDVVAERHDFVQGAWPNGLDEVPRGRFAAVDIADGDRSMDLLVVALQTCPRRRPMAWLPHCGSASSLL